MPATRVNHVSVAVGDLAAAVRFYEGLLGMERVATPDFGYPVQWLRMGSQQLHLIERPEEEIPFRAHFAVEVDDFPAVYRRALEWRVTDAEAFRHHVYELPDGTVQLYVRDPAGNLVEIDHRDAASLPEGLVADLRRLPRPQVGEHARATLYTAPPAAASGAGRGDLEDLPDSSRTGS